MTTTAEPDLDRDALLAEVADLALQVETLTEATADAQRMLTADEHGWVGVDHMGALSRDQIANAVKVAKVMAVVDPLIRRGVNLRVAYTWGTGVSISADDGKTDEDGQQNGQDVNAVVQAFLDDKANQSTFSTGQAHERLERGLAITGEKFLALATTPATGRVVVRHLPPAEVVDIYTAAEDREDPWFYKRTYVARVTETVEGALKTREETRTELYPALGFQPRSRPKTLDGHKVRWDTPVLHVAVNRPEDELRGTPDVLAALPWARGYKSFLEDWARLAKALSRFAFQATAKTKAGATKARTQITAGAADGPVGQTAIVGEGQKLEAIGKSGATIDSRSGFPLAAHVAAALDVPATMLTADPGVTGARATAETLDRPLELVINMRRDLWAGAFRQVLDYVIDCAIRAGRLSGTRTLDPYTQQERVVLANEQGRAINIDFPDLAEVDLKTLLEAIKVADDTGKVPPLVIARAVLQALREDNIDEVLDELTDENGQWVDPYLSADTAAANAALRAFRDGRDPATLLR